MGEAKKELPLNWVDYAVGFGAGFATLVASNVIAARVYAVPTSEGTPFDTFDLPVALFTTFCSAFASRAVRNRRQR